MSTHNLCFEQKYGKYQNIYLKIFIVLVVKFSVYLDRLVFIMYLENLSTYFQETFTEMKSTIRRRAEDKNKNTGLLSLGIKSF